MSNNNSNDQINQLVTQIISNLQSSGITKDTQKKPYPSADVLEQRVQKILSARKENISLGEWDGLPPKPNK